MEARGYVPDHQRTRYKQLVMQRKDTMLIVFACLVCVGMIALAVL